MSCDTLRENFGDHIDRRLPPAEAAEMDRHLASCASCRAEVEELRRVVAAVAGLPRRAAPKGFQAAVMARIQAERAPAEAPKKGKVLSLERYRSAISIVSGMAAVFLVYVGVIVVGRRNEPLPSNPSIATQDFERKKESSERSRAGEESGLWEKKSGAAPEGAGSKDFGQDKDATLKSREGLNKAQADSLDKAKTAKRAAAEPAIQRVRVYSENIAVDSRQVQDILRESGYTFMDAGKNETLMVKVPAERATQLVAALQKIDGDFRVEQKQVVREEAEKLREAERRQRGDQEGGLVAQADDLEKALRQLEEMASESDRRKAAQEGQKQPAPAAADPGEGGGQLAGGRHGGKKDLDATKNSDGKKNGQEYGAGAAGGAEKPKPKEPMKTAGGVAQGDEGPGAPRGAEPPADRPGTKEDGGPRLGNEKGDKRDESLAHGESEEAGALDDARESVDEEAKREDAIRDLLELLKKQEGGGDDVFLVIEFQEATEAKPAVK